jgi:hypothetical protein
MNRLIIIGNGFDLAHGIKTSYKDFVLNYLANSINSFYVNGHFEDKLMVIKFKPESGYSRFSDKPTPVTVQNVMDSFINLKKNNYLSVSFKSLLLKNTMAKINNMNWVDLETEYFDLLLATKQKVKVYSKNDTIENINNQLEFLKDKLVKYLDQQQREFSNLFDVKPLVDCFTETIHPHEIVTVTLEEKQLPNNLYFLNFNYTNTFENYMNECKKIIPSEFNYIHGNLFGGHGKPIFGFGDELDKRYLEFEDEKNNELFKHIKSFEYLKTKNYFLLTSFVESEHFQVHIYGHSCGLSDRTMLNQIFEHENCKSIKIFYHKIDEDRNDYTEKTYEMSRHFKDKGMMRKKVISFDRSTEMPQPMKVEKELTVEI